MKRLIWKEWREKRIWVIALLASTVSVVLLGQGYTFSGDLSTFTRLIWLSVVVAVFFGLSSFSSDLGAGSVDFTYSRPVSWKRTLLAKLVVGFAIIAFASIVAGLLYRLMGPQEYARLLTPARLAHGAATAIALMGVAYIAGMACSVVLPGTIGGTLTLMVALLLLTLARGALHTIRWTFDIQTDWLIPAVAIGWAIGLLAASVIVVRFGLTLSTGARVKRYAFFLALVVLVSSGFDLLVPANALINLFQRRDVRSRVSPDGKYVLIYREPDLGRPLFERNHYEGTLFPGGEWRLFRSSDGVTTEKEPWDYTYFFWRGTDRLVLLKETARNVWVQEVKMDAAGSLARRQVRIPVPASRGIGAIPSPAGNVLALTLSPLHGHHTAVLQFVDIAPMRHLGGTIDISTWHVRGWESETKLQLHRFVNSQMQTRYIHVSAPERTYPK